MTALGVDELKNRIMTQTVDVPENLTPNELAMWLTGYQACLERDIAIIDDMYTDKYR